MREFSAFIEKVTPALERLADQWVQPGLKNEEGYFYGCVYCDMECGGTERHDPDCLSDLAKKMIAKLLEIDSDLKYSKEHKGNTRPAEETVQMKNFFKGEALLKMMYSPILRDLVPLDYNDPENSHVSCYCNFHKKTRIHDINCESQILAQALSDLFSLKNNS